MALPPKNFLHFLLNYAILSQKIFWGNAIGNVVNQKLATLPRPDDSGHWAESSALGGVADFYIDNVASRFATPSSAKLFSAPQRC